MLILPITYEDFDGTTQTRTFHFNLTKAEISELELSKLDQNTSGFQDYLSKIIAARSGREVMESIKAVIKMTVGRREGDLFIKNEKITNEFMFSGAYSELFTKMTGDPEFAAMFVRGIVPKSMSEKVGDSIKEQVLNVDVPTKTLFSETVVPEDTRPAWIREDRPPTKPELLSMSKDQLVEVMQRDVKMRERIDEAMRGGENNGTQT
jgi:hypothetical protein